MKIKSVAITDQQDRWLKSKAKIKGIKEAEMLRRILDEVMMGENEE